MTRLDGVWPRATSRWLFPVPAGPTRQRFSLARIHSRLDRYSKVCCLTEEAATSNSSRVLVTGKAATFIRARALDRSREAISASIEDPQELFGLPALGLSRHQQLGGELPDGREPQAAAPGL